MRKWVAYRRRKSLCIILPLLFILVIYHTIANTFIITDIGYLARPLWDSAKEQWDIIPHYMTEGLSQERTCQLHGWSLNTRTTPKLIDAVIFSVELDMYEVRIRELWNVVDKFIVLESNATFTGKSKAFAFADNAERFAFAKEKLVYARVHQQSLPPNEGPFYNEMHMRQFMNQNIEKVANEGDLIIMSDVDEIPRASTLQTLKACSGVPSTLHLQLRNYIYSYEFPLDMNSWRARVERYRKSATTYSHGQESRNLLADAGWHCSFCFRTIKEFVFKMTSYSHADRVRGDQILSQDHIQDVVCTGKDIFGMYPEVYSYKDMVAQWDGASQSESAVGLPRAVLEDDKFSFLLPGGCQRQLE